MFFVLPYYLIITLYHPIIFLWSYHLIVLSHHHIVILSSYLISISYHLVILFYEIIILSYYHINILLSYRHIIIYTYRVTIIASSFKNMWKKQFKNVIFLKKCFKNKMCLGQNTAKPSFLKYFVAKKWFHCSFTISRRGGRRREKLILRKHTVSLYSTQANILSLY